MSARLSSEGLLRDYELPDYLYYPTELMPNGTRDWARVLFLQACERLNIPQGLWPTFSEPLRLPGRASNLFQMAPFISPPFDELRDSPGEWLENSMRLFKEHCAKALERVEARIKYDVDNGILTRIPKPKEKRSAISLRYEWAARRYCFREPYKDMASSTNSADSIRKAVIKILKEAKVPKRGKS